MKKRNTIAKQSVLEVLEESNSPMTQDMLESKIKSSGRDLPDRSTIYRVLNSFCEDGMAHRIVSDKGTAYYALCGSCENNNHIHDHIHFQCLSCNNIECLDEQTSISLPNKYVIKEANLWVKGYCPACG